MHLSCFQSSSLCLVELLSVCSFYTLFVSDAIHVLAVWQPYPDRQKITALLPSESVCNLLPEPSGWMPSYSRWMSHRHNLKLPDIHSKSAKKWKSFKEIVFFKQTSPSVGSQSTFFKFTSQMFNPWSQPLFHSLIPLKWLGGKKCHGMHICLSLHMTLLTKPCLELSREICITQLLESMCKLYLDWRTGWQPDHLSYRDSTFMLDTYLA